MKAFQVDDSIDESSVVVFARHAVVARREGANKLNDEFEYVTCRRAPGFDKYAPGPVPLKAKLDNGWWTSCLNCGAELTALDDPIIIHDNAYCDIWCRFGYLDRRERIANAKAAAADACLEKFPGAMNVVGHSTFGNHPEPESASFQFPGGKGTCRWFIGKSTTHVEIRDREAFGIWKSGEYRP